MALTPQEAAARLSPQAFQALLEPMMHRITLHALRESQPRTPVRTGTLRRSETTRVDSGGLRVYIGTNVVYGPFVHARVPFFAQGIDAAQPAIEGELQKLGDAFVSKVGS